MIFNNQFSQIVYMVWKKMIANTYTLRPLFQINFPYEMCIIYVWKFCNFLIQNLQKFAPNDQLNNKPVLFQIMSWHLTGDKALSEPMMV